MSDKQNGKLSKLGQSALNLARYGYGVFPLWPRAKVPATGTGFKAATNDPAQVEKWWSRGPESNIGLSVPADVVILDVDSPEAMAELVNQGLEMPATVTTKTPRGTHFWYRIDPSIEVHPRVGADAFDGIDVRARGSYVVVPPSINANGDEYRWLVKPFHENFAPAPEWFVEYASKGASEKAADGTVRPVAISPENVLSGVAEGSRDWTLFRYACRLRKQGRDRAEAEVLITTAASRSVPPFPQDEALRKVEQAWKYEAPKEDGTAEDFKIWEVTELCAIQWPEPRWLIDDILPEGLTLVYSKAKVGKSYLCGAIACAIAHGSRALGRFQANKHGVLYLDLEQSEAKSKGRWGQISKIGGLPSGLKTVFKWPRQDKGGIDRLNRVMDVQPDIGAIFVDVLARLRPASGKNTGGNAYQQEYDSLSELYDFASSAHVALVLIHHEKKGESLDPLDAANGSAAMTGVPNVIWALSRERGKTQGKMLVTGRDVVERTLHLGWDPTFGTWIVESEEGPDAAFAPRPRLVKDREEREQWP